MPPRTRKAPAKEAAPRKRAARPVVSPPKPPALDRETVTEAPEGPAPVSDENATPENDDTPKRGRKPNVVGQANARFQKAKARLDRAQRKADKVQSVQDELDAAKAEFEAAQQEYREAFEASLNNTPAAGDDDGENEDDGDE
jgi:cell division septum initiation protein DivIVA